MFSNPLIQRYRYSVMRPRQLWIYATIYAIIIFLLLMLNSAAGNTAKDIYIQFLVFQVLILFVWTAYNSGSAIGEEIADNSYDFFRMLPLSAHQKTGGIIIGKNLVSGLFAAINFILLLLLGMAGKVRFSLLYQTVLILIAGTLVINLTSLLFSINVKKRNSNSRVAIILLVIITAPFLIGATAALCDEEISESTAVRFYQTRIPVLLFITMIFLYLSGWAYQGILRRFTKEKEPLFSGKGAILFAVGSELILLGLYFAYLTGRARYTMTYLSFWAMSLFVILWVAGGASRTFDKYFENSQFIKIQSGSGRKSLLSFIRHCNLSLAIVLFVVWSVFAIGAALKAKVAPVQWGYMLFILFCSYMLLLLLLELWLIYRNDSEKIGILLGFLAILYLILPPILSGVLESELVAVISPLGLIGYMLENKHISLIMLNTVAIIHILLCVFPVLFIGKRYKEIIEVRQMMLLSVTES